MGTMNVSRRDLLKFGGIGALGLAGATALAGCAPQAAGDASKGDAAGDGSTYEGPSFLQKPADITEFAETHEYDVVVVGAGESGLSAIHTALEAGCHGRRASKACPSSRPPATWAAAVDV